MKTIKYLIAALIAAGLAASSYATVTVTWATASYTYLSDSGGVADDMTQLAPGDLLEIGTWATEPTSITGGNLALELATFEVFASGSINEGAGAFGLVSAHTAGATFGEKQIYMIAFNALTAGASTEWAIFYSSNGNWLMPADGGSTATSIDPVDLFADGGSNGVLLASGHILYGSTAVDTVSFGGPYALINTQRVPETSSFALEAVSLIAGISLFRRRRSR